ncbi:DUF692 domain-containing protein [Hydrogenophaga sp. RWCD_12]|uniref:MNIO family bufferin maturase n=1 Tax=Hydrogenophaga sp. RWCD_12 TaxID=3391190 RepID=UPI003984D444
MSVHAPVGIGLRGAHYRPMLETRPALDWLEVHTENYLADGGWDLHVLLTLRRDYPISLHGVGLDIGSVHGFSMEHVDRIARLVRRVDPIQVSDHLCWSGTSQTVTNDLLPLPLNATTLSLVCERVDRVQARLERSILLENVSSYLRFSGDTYTQTSFLAEVCRRTGCGVLLDVNNLHVNEVNLCENAFDALQTILPGQVGELHLAGHRLEDNLLVDDHGSTVAEPVWRLYEAALQRFGPVPAIIEWDTNLPSLTALLDEVQRAREVANTALDIVAHDA